MARCGPRLRVAVRGASTRPGRAADPEALDIAGPAMMLVEGVSESSGVLPTREGGEVMWAVLLDPAAGAAGDDEPAAAHATRLRRPPSQATT